MALDTFTRSEESPLAAAPTGLLREFWYSPVRNGVVIATALVLAIGTALVGPLAVIAVFGIALVLGAVFHPPVAGYAMVGLAPFVVGFERGEFLPLMRPNEGLLVVLWGAVILGWVLRRERPPLSLNTVDLWLLGLAFFGSVVPLFMAVGRLNPVGLDSVLYSITLWKLFALYYLFRVTVRTPEQVRLALWVSLATASIISVLAFFDGLNIADVAIRLNDYFPVEEGDIDDGRGAATIGNPIGMGVYAAFAFLIALAMFVNGERKRFLLACTLFAAMLGVFGSGQATALIAVAVGSLALGLVTRRTFYLARLAIPFILVVGALSAPLVMRRVDDLEPAISSKELKEIEALPGQEQPAARNEINPGSSWDVRVFNLEHYFLPRFDDPINVLIGVDPQPRAEADEKFRDFVWIESGYVWLLWIGGAPFVLAFVGFAFHTARATARIARARRDPIGDAAAAGFAAVMIMVVAMALDPHLTLRGTADLFYPLIALAVAGSPGRMLVDGDR